jgi:myo-inositol-1(or 4)-monophosphatase
MALPDDEGHRSGPGRARPLAHDWLGLCRRATHAAREAVSQLGSTAERAVPKGEGEGGDTTLAVDRAAEDAVFAELSRFGAPLLAVSEERGEVSLNGGDDDASVRVVIDPVDGSINAKRGLPFACVSIAVASGPRMRDVEVAYVAELDPPRDWWAMRGEGAFHGGVRHETADISPQRAGPPGGLSAGGKRLAALEPGPLEVLALETARPALVAGAAEAIAGLEARRLRVLGSVAAAMCLVAAGRLDAMVTLREVRSVDVAAAQLIVSEAGGAVALPGGDELDLSLRTRAAAARDAALLERVRATLL